MLVSPESRQLKLCSSREVVLKSRDRISDMRPVVPFICKERRSEMCVHTDLSAGLNGWSVTPKEQDWMISHRRSGEEARERASRSRRKAAGQVSVSRVSADQKPPSRRRLSVVRGTRWSV